MTDTKRVMVDIETLGLEPGSAILSIGAVTFTPDGLGHEYYNEISLESCQDEGLELDANTLEWWLDQDDDVTGVLTGGDSLGYILSEFADWFPEGAQVWANSPAFDCAHLESAFDAVGLTEPWEYYDTRDVRTLREEIPTAPEVEQEGNEHDALDDARHQARIVSETLWQLQNE